MKPRSTEDVLDLLGGHLVSATLGTAMELGLFWLLAERPMSALDVADSLSIPLNRCHHWLRLLLKLGLLEDRPDGYVPSTVARTAILDAQSRHFWAFHARGDREAFNSVRDLALNIGRPMSAWAAPSLEPRVELQRLREDAGYAAGFTRMLFEIHLPLAEQLANLLDLQGVRRLIDVGGGSGVISFALLRRRSELTSVVVDAETICQVGRELALENGLERRITFLAADALEDELPTGFDMAILCDTGLFNALLFRRLHDVLNANGRLAVVDKFAPTRTDAPPSRLPSAFLASLEYPAQSINLTTAEMAQALLHEAGFRDLSSAVAPHRDTLPWNVDWVVLEARK